MVKTSQSCLMLHLNSKTVQTLCFNKNQPSGQLNDAKFPFILTQLFNLLDNFYAVNIKGIKLLPT